MRLYIAPKIDCSLFKHVCQFLSFFLTGIILMNMSFHMKTGLKTQKLLNAL